MGTAAYPAEMEPNNVKAMANPLAAGTNGFTASLWPLGDVDYFEFDVVTAGSSATVTTSDGKGGCPAGAHTYVRIDDNMGNAIAEDPGTAGCASLTPANSPALTSLPIGKYFVHVESATLTILPFYILDIKVTAPFCGDGIVQFTTGEQCDHGAKNGVPPDGCSATCQITTGNYVDEKEPNDQQLTANSLVGHTGAVGQISPVGDVDWYFVSVTVAGSSITAEIGDGFGGCPLGFDSQLSLFNGTMVELVSDQTSGVSPCSKITPQKYAAASNLPVGTYGLKVERLSAKTQPYYVLTVNVAPPSCGDGILPELNKQCDPGATPVPGCSATCQLTGDFIPETEPNNTPVTANALGSHAGFIGAINYTADVDYFSFTVPGPNSLVFLQTSDGIGGCPKGFQSVLHLYDTNGIVLATDTTSAGGGCSAINPLLYSKAMNLPGGTYRARVEFAGNASAFWEYVLNISVKQPGCGNGVIEAGEQCDDGAANGTAGDLCTAACKSIPPWEIEPNNATGTATAQWSGFSTWKAAISPIGDHDYFWFQTIATSTVTLTTHDIDKPTYCTSDNTLYLLDHNGTQIAMDNDHGPGPGDGTGQCAKIVQSNLPAGTYYAWVQSWMDQKLIPGYQLDLLVQ